MGSRQDQWRRVLELINSVPVESSRGRQRRHLAAPSGRAIKFPPNPATRISPHAPVHRPSARNRRCVRRRGATFMMTRRLRRLRCNCARPGRQSMADNMDAQSTPPGCGLRPRATLCAPGHPSLPAERLAPGVRIALAVRRRSAATPFSIDRVSSRTWPRSDRFPSDGRPRGPAAGPSRPPCSRPAAARTAALRCER